MQNSKQEQLGISSDRSLITIEYELNRELGFGFESAKGDPRIRVLRDGESHRLIVNEQSKALKDRGSDYEFFKKFSGMHVWVGPKRCEKRSVEMPRGKVLGIKDT